MEKLGALTKELLNELNELQQIYENGKEPSKDKTFFQYVKKETESLYDKLDKWEKFATDLIKRGKLVLHLSQIEATKDNMTALIMHSYYKDVRKRRYMDIYKSCQFIFQQLLKELTNERSIDSRS